MPKLYTDHQLFKVHQVKQCLEDAGIPCVLKNEFAQGAIGELSAIDNLPEVWLIDEEWRPKAEKLIATLMAEPATTAGEHADWVCNECAAENEAQFGVCWQCQSSC